MNLSLVISTVDFSISIFFIGELAKADAASKGISLVSKSLMEPGGIEVRFFTPLIVIVVLSIKVWECQ